MISLIKNELTKIFHKKSLYIILLIALGFMILGGILSTFFKNTNMFDDLDAELYRQELSSLNKNDPDYKQIYTSLKSNLETAELSKKYDRNSWQRYIINNKGSEIIYNMVEKENTPEYSKFKEEYDKLVKSLDSNDWKNFANQELEEINAQIKEVEQQKNLMKKDDYENQIENLNDQKQVVEWRLEKDISYGNSNKNSMLEQWLQENNALRTMKQQEKGQPLKYSEKYGLQYSTETVNLSEYAIKNNLDEKVALYDFNNRKNLVTEADSELIQCFSDSSLFIIIAVVVIAGTIVSEEFNKGTVKLLLVRPYKRIKILIAKFIACLVVLAITYMFIAIAQFIMSGIIHGFENYTSNVFIYNYNSNSVEQIGVFKYLLQTGVAVLPQYLLLMTLAFTLSVLFVSSPIAIALPLLGTMGANIINEIAYNFEQARFLKFFVTPNWDLSIYMFGKIPAFEPISLPFSIAICSVYFIAMIVFSLFIFNKKEIKNI